MEGEAPAEPRKILKFLTADHADEYRFFNREWTQMNANIYKSDLCPFAFICGGLNIIISYKMKGEEFAEPQKLDHIF